MTPNGRAGWRPRGLARCRGLAAGLRRRGSASLDPEPVACRPDAAGASTRTGPSGSPRPSASGRAGLGWQSGALGAVGRDRSRPHRRVPRGGGSAVLPPSRGRPAGARAGRVDRPAPPAHGLRRLHHHDAAGSAPPARSPDLARQGAPDPLGAPARAPPRQADDSRAVPEPGAAGPGRRRRRSGGRTLLRRFAHRS